MCVCDEDRRTVRGKVKKKARHLCQWDGDSGSSSGSWHAQDGDKNGFGGLDPLRG